MNNLITQFFSFIGGFINSNYLTSLDAAYYVGISDKFLLELTKANFIKSVNGKYRKCDLDKWIKEYRIINQKFLA